MIDVTIEDIIGVLEKSDLKDKNILTLNLTTKNGKDYLNLKFEDGNVENIEIVKNNIPKKKSICAIKDRIDELEKIIDFDYKKLQKGEITFEEFEKRTFKEHLEIDKLLSAIGEETDY